MGFFQKVGRFASSPYVSAFSNFKKAAISLRSAAAGVAQANREVLQKKDDLSGMTPKQQYERLYVENEWTAAEIYDQKRSFNSTRRASLFVVGLLASVILYIAIFKRDEFPWWQMMIFGPMFFAAVLMGAVQAFKFALMYFQLEREEILSAADLLKQPDFFRRMFL